MNDKPYRNIGDPLDCLAEECAETIQAIMKIKRFGWARHEGKKKLTTNREDLLEEIGDVEFRHPRASDFVQPPSEPVGELPTAQEILGMAVKEFDGDEYRSGFNLGAHRVRSIALGVISRLKAELAAYEASDRIKTENRDFWRGKYEAEKLVVAEKEKEIARLTKLVSRIPEP